MKQVTLFEIIRKFRMCIYIHSIYIKGVNLLKTFDMRGIYSTQYKVFYFKSWYIMLINDKILNYF